MKNWLTLNTVIPSEKLLLCSINENTCLRYDYKKTFNRNPLRPEFVKRNYRNTKSAPVLFRHFDKVRYAEIGPAYTNHANETNPLRRKTTITNNLSYFD